MALEVNIKLDLDELVKKFLALRGHAEKCDFFQKHPELGAVFRGIHFAANATQTEQPNKTKI